MKVNMKKMDYAWLTLLVAGLAFASCQEEELESLNQKYETSWNESMGKVDPNHTWNTAGLGIVSANIGGEGKYNLKLYTSNPRMTSKSTYLLAKYEVEGGTTLKQKFDMPANLTHIYASLVDDKGYRIVKSAKIVDGMVKLNFTEYSARAIADGADDVVSWTTTKDNDGNITYYYFNADDYKTALDALPENTAYDPQKFEEITNTVLYTNFLYLSTGNKFTIYPFYNVTDVTTTKLGIFYYDNNGNKIEHDIWERSTAEKYNNNGEWETIGTGNTPDHSYGNYTNSGRVDKDGNPINTPLRIPGITISVKKGIKFGFYKTTHQQVNPKVYSESSLNNIFNNTTHFGATYHSHYRGNCEYFLTFEDYDDLDYNDLIIKIGDEPVNGDVGSLNDQQILPIVDIEEEINTPDVPMTYIVAYEDMGAIGDFDFNDAVLGIEYISTNIGKQARFKVMAAGGTLPISVTYGETNIWPEIHEAFGKESQYPINVGSNSNNDVSPVYSEYISVEDDFTIMTHAYNLKINVTKNNETSTSINIPNPDKEKGAIPQAFLIADPEWEWPREGQHIINNTEYGNEFSQWIADETYTNWYGKAWTENDEEENPGEGGGDNTGGDSDEEPDYSEYGTKLDITIANPTIISKDQLAVGMTLTVLTNGSGLRCGIYNDSWGYYMRETSEITDSIVQYTFTETDLNNITNNIQIVLESGELSNVIGIFLKPAATE